MYRVIGNLHDYVMHDQTHWYQEHSMFYTICKDQVICVECLQTFQQVQANIFLYSLEKWILIYEGGNGAIETTRSTAALC